MYDVYSSSIQKKPAQRPQIVPVEVRMYGYGNDPAHPVVLLESILAS